MFSIIRTVVALLAAAALIAPSAAVPTPDVAPGPPDVSISNIIYGGTGCPQDSAYVSLSSDRQSFTAYFNKFIVYMNTATDNVKDARKFCQLNLAVNSPPGWQFTIVQTSFTGYASIGPGVSATITSTNYFSGSANEQSFSVPIYGPTYRDFTLRSTSIVGDGQWSPCGTQALLNIKSELQLSGDGYGAIRETRGSGNLSRIYALQWRTC
ncbi:hypothetical protein H072_9282 [Dactylellina haptotyla CBS 200.50]|uniref:DUF4360 domain-containing protein n=1 Tax=Dactylellina haptotyla (strain CBS 200.50) TaxID=1284197 RepID=S8A316_DACHA|nr:hypothetical protein H072_9282 [Dactylellina haptotyla CBS 200.50]